MLAVWLLGQMMTQQLTLLLLEAAGDGPSGVFDSAVCSWQAQLSHIQFEEVGEFPYFCMVHPWMEGIVTVQAAGAMTKMKMICMNDTMVRCRHGLMVHSRMDSAVMDFWNSTRLIGEFSP